MNTVAKLAAFVLNIASGNPAHLGSGVRDAHDLLEELGIEPRQANTFFHDKKKDIEDARRRLKAAAVKKRKPPKPVSKFWTDDDPAILVPDVKRDAKLVYLAMNGMLVQAGMMFDMTPDDFVKHGEWLKKQPKSYLDEVVAEVQELENGHKN